MKKSLLFSVLPLAMFLASNEAWEQKPRKRFFAAKKKKSPEEIAKAHGLKCFYYGDHCITALNQKNADRKAKKIGLI